MDMNLYCLMALASDRLREMREQAARAALGVPASRRDALPVTLGRVLRRLAARTTGPASVASPTS